MFICISLLPKDVQLWEDLCQLEGKMGQRYLTHESEDAFWTRQGAKTHPLAEREKRAQQNQKYINVSIIEEQPSNSSSNSSGGREHRVSFGGVSQFSNGSTQSGVGVQENDNNGEYDVLQLWIWTFFACLIKK